jgi:hypothetical protein
VCLYPPKFPEKLPCREAFSTPLFNFESPRKNLVVEKLMAVRYKSENRTSVVAKPKGGW